MAMAYLTIDVAAIAMVELLVNLSTKVWEGKYAKLLTVLYFVSLHGRGQSQSFDLGIARRSIRGDNIFMIINNSTLFNIIMSHEFV